LPKLVAKQPDVTPYSTDDKLLRKARLGATLLTSTSRTAWCGPACRVVWQGPVSYTDCPYADCRWRKELHWLAAVSG
ncbi:MAG: hypothetical protein ACK4ML_16090, partial [Alishewanella aestuarii]